MKLLGQTRIATLLLGGAVLSLGTAGTGTAQVQLPDPMILCGPDQENITVQGLGQFGDLDNLQRQNDEALAKLLARHAQEKALTDAKQATLLAQLDARAAQIEAARARVAQLEAELARREAEHAMALASQQPAMSDSSAELAARAEALDAQRLSLLAGLADARAARDEALEQAERLQEQLTEAEHKLGDSVTRASLLEGTLAEQRSAASARLQQLQSEYRKSQERSLSATLDLTDAQQQAAYANKQLGELSEQMAELKAELAATKAAAEAQEAANAAELAQLTGDLKTTEASLFARLAEAKQQAGSIKAKTAEAAVANDRAASLEQQLNLAKVRVDGANAAKVTTRMALGEALQDLGNVREDVQGRDREMAVLNGQIATQTNAHTSRVLGLNRRIAELEVAQQVGAADLDAATLAGMRATERANALEQKLSLAIEQAEGESAALASSSRAALSDALERFNAQRGEVDALKAQIAKQTGAHKAMVLDLNRRIAEADVRFGQQLTELEASNQRLSTAMATAEAQRLQIADLEAQLAATRGENQRLRDVSWQRGEQILRLQTQLTRTRSKLQKSRGRLAVCRRDNRVARAAINQAPAPAADLHEKVRTDFIAALHPDVNGAAPIHTDMLRFGGDVLFNSGSAILSTSGRELLHDLVVPLNSAWAAIPEGEDWVITIEGHADKAPIRRSRYRSNRELSVARAISVAAYLVEQTNVTEQDVMVAGFGEFRPIDSAETPEAYAQNRRVELGLLKR